MDIQGVHWILCFFRFLKNIPDSGLSLFSLGISVCTHTKQVENQRCNRTGRVRKNHKILRKKTQYLMNTLYVIKDVRWCGGKGFPAYKTHRWISREPDGPTIKKKLNCCCGRKMNISRYVVSKGRFKICQLDLIQRGVVGVTSPSCWPSTSPSPRPTTTTTKTSTQTSDQSQS